MYAALAVGSFSIAHTLNVLLNTEIPEIDESLAWAADAGFGIGIAVAFVLGFVAWLYLSFGTFLIAQMGRKALSAVRVTRRVGIAFLFPLVGFSASIFLEILGSSSLVANGLYVLSILYGLAVIALALSQETEDPFVLGAAAVATPFIVAVAILAVLAVVGQNFVVLEAEP